jgi:tRNA G10  N-methylase Trm11
LPYLIPRALVNKKRIILVLAFGALSIAEARSVFSGLERVERLCDRAAILALRELDDVEIKRIAGIHKLISPLLKTATLSDSSEEIADFLKPILDQLDENFNFSVSLYCEDANTSYDDAVNLALSAVRSQGFRRARLVRPRNTTELRAEDVLSRQVIDLVFFQTSDSLYFGTTAYVQDPAEFHAMDGRRPVANPTATLSPRLAKALVNIANLRPGELLLDPFCGAGTILAATIMQGVNCIGTDVSHESIKKANVNLSWLVKQSHLKRIGSFELKVADARKLEDVVGPGKVDAVVTEPILLPVLHSVPNFESAKRMMDMSSSVYSESLHSMASVVKKGGRIVIVVPTLKTTNGREVSISFEDTEDVGLRKMPLGPSAEQEYPIPVDFSSTRWIRRSVYAFLRIGN